MTITFYKYHGTGNDFIIVDNRLQNINKNKTHRIAQLCNRRFGIGADGFIFLENDTISDFNMAYYNADGNKSSMCGNGGRCITAFAKFLNIIEKETQFMAIDGLHKAKIEDNTVHLQMQDVVNVEKHKTHLFLDTGSPHHVEYVTHLKDLDVKLQGAKIRYGKPYNDAGSNVNFVEQLSEDTFAVRTYERGVEDETLSCGTGATAVALAMYSNASTQSNTVKLKTLGGDLKVTFKISKNGYNNIWLIGPTKLVFKGKVEW